MAIQKRRRREISTGTLFALLVAIVVTIMVHAFVAHGPWSPLPAGGADVIDTSGYRPTAPAAPAHKPACNESYCPLPAGGSDVAP